MIIYKITNLTNGKLYIGQTVQKPKKRWAAHLNKGHALFNAVKKYGKDNFKMEILDVANSLEELNIKEIQWIQELNTLAPMGYNLRLGGDGGGSLSELTRDRIGKSAKGRKHSEEWKNAMSQKNSGENNPMFGKQISKEAADKRKKSMEKYYNDPQYLQNLSQKQSKRLEDPEQLLTCLSALENFRKREDSGKILSEAKLGKKIDKKNSPIFEVYKKDTGEFIGEWTHQKRCAEFLNIPHKGINTVLKGVRPSHKGYVFKYKKV